MNPIRDDTRDFIANKLKHSENFSIVTIKNIVRDTVSPQKKYVLSHVNHVSLASHQEVASWGSQFSLHISQAKFDSYKLDNKDPPYEVYILYNNDTKKIDEFSPGIFCLWLVLLVATCLLLLNSFPWILK